jgi:hypothetical protein
LIERRGVLMTPPRVLEKAGVTPRVETASTVDYRRFLPIQVRLPEEVFLPADFSRAMANARVGQPRSTPQTPAARKVTVRRVPRSCGAIVRIASMRRVRPHDSDNASTLNVLARSGRGARHAAQRKESGSRLAM